MRRFAPMRIALRDENRREPRSEQRRGQPDETLEGRRLLAIRERKAPQRMQALHLSLDLLCRAKGLQFRRSLNDVVIIVSPNALKFGNLRCRRPAGITLSGQTPFDFK